MAKQTFAFNVSLPVTFLKEGKYFVAYSPAIDMSTSASTFEKVKNRFDELVKIFFEDLIERGTLEQVLSGLGWRKIEAEWIPPQVIGQESQRFEHRFVNC